MVEVVAQTAVDTEMWDLREVRDSRDRIISTRIKPQRFIRNKITARIISTGVRMRITITVSLRSSNSSIRMVGREGVEEAISSPMVPLRMAMAGMSLSQRSNKPDTCSINMAELLGMARWHMEAVQLRQVTTILLATP